MVVVVVIASYTLTISIVLVALLLCSNNISGASVSINIYCH